MSNFVNILQNFPFHYTKSQGVHSSSTVNIHVFGQQGYYLEQACTKCMYGRPIAIEWKVDIFLIFSPCVHTEMYFGAVRFVHILLDFSQIGNVYMGVLIRG
jgi:hypothetical protein